MSDMKCPICDTHLHKIPVKEAWVCSTHESKHELYGTKELWQALIRTRKALEFIKKELDIRKKQVEIANKAFDFINTEWDNVDCSRKELGACAFNAKEDIAGWESDIETAELALDQITALEQKEEK